MKVCIYGAGAIGGYLAAGLSKLDDVELSLIARGPHLKAIKENGLTLIKDGETTVCHPHATDDPASLGPQDYVIVCLKAHQAWQAADTFAPLLGPDTAVVTGQNGVPWWYAHALPAPLDALRLQSVDAGNRQWDRIGAHRAIGCAVYPATEISAPGEIRHIYGDKFALGEPDGSQSDRVLKLSDAMQRAGFKAPVLDDIRSELWLKLWGNLCFNPISALTGQTLDIVATEPSLRKLSRDMMLEAQAMAERYGVTFRVDVERRINGAAKVGAHRTSMLQDLEAGRAMEIDALVTAVQEMARAIDHPTPTIDAVLGLVQHLGLARGLYEPLAAHAHEDGAATTGLAMTPAA
ncbi:MAG: 2-dehydropantoate 2-reductase [Pseudomonadota bacterium]